MTAKQISNSTCKNPLLSKVLYYVKMGWPDEVPTTMQPYADRKEVEGSCLMWGLQVIIPPELQPKMNKLLHETHPGIIKIKVLARSYVWWPGIDKDLERCSKSCEACQQQQKVEARTPLHPLQFPSRPWQRLHLDFAGPFQGHMWLIVVDAFSKWPEVVPMKITTATRTIDPFLHAGDYQNKLLQTMGPSLHLKNFRSLFVLMELSTLEQLHIIPSPMGL